MKSVVYHGRGSSPDKIDWLIAPIREAGFEVVVPNIREVADAYEAGIRELPVDLAAGHSMGGTAALLLAARNPGKVGCVVAVAGPVDRRLQLQWLEGRGDKYSKRLANELASLGPQLDETSPSRYIGQGMPPVLYIRGERDDLVPRAHVDVLVGLADKFGFRVDIVEVRGMGHVPKFEEERRKIADVVKNFLSNCPRRP
ncbi:MAG: prolyl oligopeptidase family serine peptidase [Thermoproteus sp.]|nr:prolyl oligopeptidase family serine peptidase [Thermoproteus sp.]